jgi:FkbM family methyltransferase
MINDLQNVVLMQAGLGEREGLLNLVTQDASGRALGGTSRITPRSEPPGLGNSEPVRVVAVDELVPSDREIAILHLDVEGFEQQALCGALKTIRRALPIIIVETMPEESWLATNILSLGYRATLTLHGNTVLTFNREST